MRSANDNSHFDCLYGDVTLAPEIADLASKPLVQRLRHVRLSNIDSLDMPGISNISRYEHALGTAYLCDRIGLAKSLSRDERLLLEAAALIHDTAIAPFGHLAEEALQYTKAGFNHEQQWTLLLAGDEAVAVGGVDLQLYLGRQSGLRQWVLRTFGSNVNLRLSELFELIRGKGRLGKMIAGDMDVDNLDNVTRIAYHMGLQADRSLPLRIVESICGMAESGDILFNSEVVPYIRSWLELREAVYDRLMLSEADFSGKLMLLYATVAAFEAGRFTLSDWKWTDTQYLDCLLGVEDRNVKETVERWLLGEIWDLAPFLWVEGTAPPFSVLREFSIYVSRRLGREYFAYRIKDKRKRCVRIAIRSEGIVEVGEDSARWLLGGGSPARRAFTAAEAGMIAELTTEFFRSHCYAHSRSVGATLF